MKRRCFSSVIVGLCLMLAARSSQAEVDDAFFETQIRPVLVQRCFECHSRENPKNGLRVDSRDALIAGGESGAAIVPGNAEGSRLVRAIRHTDENLQMPPTAPLPKEVVADFVRWINAGAPWPAFEPVKKRRVVSNGYAPARSPDDPQWKPAMQLWLKADGRAWQDGQSIHLWEDSSGKGHDLAATAGARAGGIGGAAKFAAQSRISGFPAVRFDTNSGLGGNAATAPDIVGDSEFTLILVVRMRGGSEPESGFIAGFGEPGGPNNPGRARCAGVEFPSGPEWRPVLFGGWGNDARPTSQAKLSPLDGPSIFVVTKRCGEFATTADFSINGLESGALVGNTAIPDFARRNDLGFFMGRVQPWARSFTGDVAEVILYNRALSADEHKGIESHLSSKYRIPLATTSRELITEVGDPAFYPNHWAFEPVKKADRSDDAASEASQTIDRFIEAKHAEQQLRPVGQADARTLVRRLYFDLIGLPPTAAQMDQAVASLTPWNDAAWGTLIDTLLASPHYGERWGRHWLDVVHYADTAGDNADYPVPEAIYFRDYVVDSFNADKPYDQFVREQLAGDILAAEGPRDKYAERVAATGFLALSRRYGTAPYELWHLTLEDTIDTVGQAFMGLTLRCARCHDHKFDPVTQNDYYALYGIFESTQFPWAGGEEFQSQKFPRLHFAPMIPADEAAPYAAEHVRMEKQVNEQIADLEKNSPLSKSLADLSNKLAELKSTSSSASETDAVKQEQGKVRKQMESKKAEIRGAWESVRRRGFPEAVPIAYAVHEGTPRSSVFQKSGDPAQPGAVVPRGVPSFLTSVESPAIPDSESGRRQFAEWLTRPNHPLTARVFVNRIWQHHFGKGLVATPSNFGLRGAAPSHPELLDWLAQRFVESGWSVKSMHRLILKSQAWRLASSHDSENATRDPGNVFLWRHDRSRLEAESIRDAMLASSGELDLTKPGAHAFPPILNWTYTQHSQFKDFYPSRHRSIYLMTARLQRHPFLALFDSPDTNTTSPSRTSSIVPAQALYLMNSDEIKAEAVSFARRALTEPSENRIAVVYSLAFQRKPTDEEAAKANEFLANYAQLADEQSAWTAFCRSLLTSHEFFYVD